MQPSPPRSPSTLMSLVLLDAMTNVRFNDDAHALQWHQFDLYVGEGAGDVQVRKLQVYQIYY